MKNFIRTYLEIISTLLFIIIAGLILMPISRITMLLTPKIIPFWNSVEDILRKLFHPIDGI